MQYIFLEHEAGEKSQYINRLKRKEAEEDSKIQQREVTNAI